MTFEYIPKDTLNKIVDLLDSLSNKIKKKIRLKYEHDKFEKERLNLSKEIIELKNELHLTSKETSEIVNASLNKLKKMEDANSSIDILDYQFAVMDLLSLKFEHGCSFYAQKNASLTGKLFALACKRKGNHLSLA